MGINYARGGHKIKFYGITELDIHLSPAFGLGFSTLISQTYQL